MNTQKPLKKEKTNLLVSGLKEKVGLKDLEDEDIAETEEVEEDKFIGALDKEHWFKVTKQELRSEVLDKVEEDLCIHKIRSFILSSETKQNE